MCSVFLISIILFFRTKEDFDWWSLKTENNYKPGQNFYVFWIAILYSHCKNRDLKKKISDYNMNLTTQNIFYTQFKTIIYFFVYKTTRKYKIVPSITFSTLICNVYRSLWATTLWNARICKQVFFRKKISLFVRKKTQSKCKVKH